MYREALRMATSDVERRRIIAAAEGFLSGFMDSLVPVADVLQRDPSLGTKLQEAMKSGTQVIKESDGRPIDDVEKIR